jgi:hypothetical protein
VRAERIQLPRIVGKGGVLSVAEARSSVPFEIRRVYWVYDLKPAARRGGHAHRELAELAIALRGSFTIALDDGLGETRHVLDDPAVGLLIPPMTWREFSGFSPGAAYLMLASAPYDEAQYIRDREAFRSEARATARPVL